MRCVFQWQPAGLEQFEVCVDLDPGRVQHFRNLNRFIGEPVCWNGCYFERAASFMVWYGGGPELDAVLAQLRDHYRRVTGRGPAPDRAYANFLKGFLGAMSYQYDKISLGYREYGRFPIEMLHDLVGDCECQSFFLASLFALSGFRTALLAGFTKPGRTGGHLATGLALDPEPGDDVVDGREPYLYCEAVAADLPVGKCGFEFELFKKHATVWHVAPEKSWTNYPPAWTCSACRRAVEPWVHQCPGCGGAAVFLESQARGDNATDWDGVQTRFREWLDWAVEAPVDQLAREMDRMIALPIWSSIPSGNRRYIERASSAWSRDPEGSGTRNLVEGARNHLMRAWPHAVAAVLCRRPDSEAGEQVVAGGMSILGKSIYEMDNRTLASFADKILLDVTCSKIRGFGSRSAIGAILKKYLRLVPGDDEAEAYMREKRGSIENVLGKVVIPQLFTLLAAQHKPAPDAQ